MVQKGKGTKRASKRRKMTLEERLKAKEKREKNKFRANVKAIFTKSGFTYIKSENKHFTFKTSQSTVERSTELDGVFVYENVLVIVEDTCDKKPNKHLSSKFLIFGMVSNSQSDFVECLRENIPSFSDYFDRSQYDADDYVVVPAYFPMFPVGPEQVAHAESIGTFVVEKPLMNYFYSLASTVSGSAKYEIFKFFRLSYSDIGKANFSAGSSSPRETYTGFLLPEKNSSYPAGYKVVSFYADPASLLKKSFVVRKNSWRDPNISYQRILESRKIKSMRRYLNDKKRVYVNNIIATLPSSTKILDQENENQLSPGDITRVRPVKITLPDEYNVVSVIDGQHRIFSYHEGTDLYEANIAKLRDRQNLLVTGIIHPESISEQERVQFEAKLFLEINSEQTKVKSALTQEIELLVNPYSATAVAKSVISRLSKTGVLSGILEEHVFDDSDKLKVTSIVSYGLKPLTKKEGSDSLFEAWGDDKKEEIVSVKQDSASNEKKSASAVLERYIEFCVSEINLFLSAVRQVIGEKWSIGHEPESVTLQANIPRKSPSALTGAINCRKIGCECLKRAA